MYFCSDLNDTMQIIESLPFRPEKGLAATIGFFDGVHAGHRALLADVQTAAAEKGLASGIITFREHPKTVLTHERMPLLTTTEERMALLAATGIDFCILLDFTPAVAGLSAYDFMASIHERYGVQHLTIGYDHRFGHDSSDTPDDYRRYGEKLGITVSQSAAYMPDGRKASSSAIRRLLGSGEVREAARLLSYEYRLEGTVVEGQQLGRRIGFPTANIVPACADKIIPANGAYAVRVWLDGGKEYGGMLNIGTHPTVTPDSRVKNIEAHLFDFNSSLYGQRLRIEFVEFLRPEYHMDNIESLRMQLLHDREKALGILF